MNVHHKRAAFVFPAVLAADALLGLAMAAAEHVSAWHGVYCTTGLTTTDGCDLAFHGWVPYAIAWFTMVMMVPFWTAIFSLVTTGFIADHTDRQHARLMEKIDG